MATKEKETIEFKSAISELEAISQWFQNEDIDLDEGLKKLNRAKELIASCKGRLSQVENEFNTLKKEIGSTSAPYIADEEVVLIKKNVSNDELPF